jgi:hypothetical protein
MRGFERADRQFLDAAALAGHLVPENSMFAFLAAHRAEVFPDADYADLFSPPGVGRPSLSATQMAAVLRLQALHDYPDLRPPRRPGSRGGGDSEDDALAWYGDSAYGTGELRAAIAAAGHRARRGLPGHWRPTARRLTGCHRRAVDRSRILGARRPRSVLAHKPKITAPPPGRHGLPAQAPDAAPSRRRNDICPGGIAFRHAHPAVPPRTWSMPTTWRSVRSTGSLYRSR